MTFKVSGGGRNWRMDVDDGEALCVAQDGSLMRFLCGDIDGLVSAYVRLLEVSRDKSSEDWFCYDYRSAC